MFASGVCRYAAYKAYNSDLLEKEKAMNARLRHLSFG